MGGAAGADDRYRATFTVRNASQRAIEATLTPRVTQGGAGKSGTPLAAAPQPQQVNLAPGEAREIYWDMVAPIDAGRLQWELIAALQSGKLLDRIRVTQKVVPAVAVRTFQATLLQLDKPVSTGVQIPADAIPGRGGVEVHARGKLAAELAGVREYMNLYPYTCVEQLVSRAVALRDQTMWDSVMAGLSAYLDRDGLVKYWPVMQQGSDVLTAYVLAIAHESGWKIPEQVRSRMTQALLGFVDGKVVRYSDLPTADLAIRKLSALEAISRYQPADIERKRLGSFQIEPNLWPTSAVLDWYGLLTRAPQLSERDKWLNEAEQIIRARLNFQGTTMGFSTERGDALWWLMISGDVNANRLVLAFLDRKSWREDMPRLIRGAIGRQQRGHWNTTVANAWGVLAMEKFSASFESVPVTGVTRAAFADQKREINWHSTPKGASVAMDWPAVRGDLSLQHAGSGKPWITVQSRAAIPLKQALSSGYKIVRTVSPVERKSPDAWTRGDVLRVRLALEAQSDMTWVVVNDPIPAGSSILGTGLGKDSKILSGGESRKGWAWPAFEERTFEAFRAYYRFVPKGNWVVEYSVRLNNSGTFELPETRVEAMYSPEMFGAIPNSPLEVKP